MSSLTSKSSDNKCLSISSDGLKVSAHEHTAYYRYATPTDGFCQHKLTPVGTEPPESALWVSPGVWFLTDAEVKKLRNYTPSRNIQHTANSEGRSFFQVVAESDAIEDGLKPEQISESLLDFAQELGIQEDDCQLYYSGRRSVHLETDSWVRYDEWKNLREKARTFNEENGASLDVSIYKPLPQFRRPGVEHRDTGMSKVPIHEDDSLTEVVRKGNIKKGHRQEGTNIHYTARVDGTESLLAEIDRKLLSSLIKESGGETTTRLFDVQPFSPYANTGQGERSVCVLADPKVIEHDGQHYARGYVKEAHGGNGQYVRYDSMSDVKLSPTDAKKFPKDAEQVVLIGGRSRSSRVFEIRLDESDLLKKELRENGRQAGLKLLTRWGYDVGSPGLIEGNYTRGDGMSRRIKQLKSRMENGQVPWSYPNVRDVSASILRTRGFAQADAWIERHCTFTYDSESTHAHLTDIAEGLNRKPDGQPQIEIP